MKDPLIELSNNGKLLVVTDIHGNLKDFNKYIKIWESGEHEYFVFTGDLIHAMDLKEDGSVEIIYKVRDLLKSEKNIYLLLGNHEWSVITGIPIYKGGINLTIMFERLLKSKFGDGWKEILDEFKTFFKKFHLAVRTSNKVFISHAGPSRYVESIEDIMKVKDYDDPILYELIWNRYGDYSLSDIDRFLEKVGCNAMVVGHTPVNGVELIGKKQMILSSSFSLGKKAYLSLNLESEVKNAIDLLKYVKFIN